MIDWESEGPIREEQVNALLKGLESAMRQGNFDVCNQIPGQHKLVGQPRNQRKASYLLAICRAGKGLKRTFLLHRRTILIICSLMVVGSVIFFTSGGEAIENKPETISLGLINSRK